MSLAEETLECTATDHQGLGTPAGKLFRRRLSDPTADEALGPRPDPGLRRSEAGPPLVDALHRGEHPLLEQSQVYHLARNA